MNQGYWFKSNLFQIQDNEDEETNPGCYGKELGTWLVEKLRENGYHVEDIIAEDWGWCVMCSQNDYMLWVGCGSMMTEAQLEENNENTTPNGEDVIWHVFPVVEIPFLYFKSHLKKMFGKLNTDLALKKLDSNLKSILEKENQIKFCEEP